MIRAIRIAACVCAFFVVVVVFQAPTVRAVDPDSDGDGLTDGYEDTNLYVQRSAASGMPKGIIDNGAGATSVTLLPWQGLVAGGFAEFEIDHPAKTQLTVQVGYWDGSKWVDRHVWDPGSRLLGVTITQPAANAVLEGMFTATATVPADDIVAKVEFFIGTTLVATATVPSAANTYSASIDPVSFPVGTYELKAVMTDKLGASKTATVTVQIDDRAAPSVSFAQPTSGAYVKGTYSVKVSAADASGISLVNLKIDAGSYFAITNSYSGGYYWYTWSTGSLSNGAHSLTAEATDRRGKVSTATVSVTVDNAAPSVSITSPANGAVKSGVVTVTAAASDNAGVYAVAFYVDGGWRATDMTSPYEYVWDTWSSPDGSHSVKATATDRAGNSASHTISVTTSNGGGGGGGGGCDPVCPTSPGPVSLADASILDISTTTTLTTSGFTQTGTVSTLTVDLLKSRTQVTQVERDNRMLPAEFSASLLHSQLTWRITIRDWVYSGGGGGGGGGGGCDPACPTGTMSVVEPVVLTSETTSTSTQGTLRTYAIRLEERSDKTKAQTDDDGLKDGTEVLTHATYPVTPDTDGDGARDNIEAAFQTIAYSVNGASRSATVKTNPLDADTDDDRLLDGEEYGLGVDRVVTHPVDFDTDDDLLTDGDEILIHSSNATLTDTDKDTISDYTEVNTRNLILTINGAAQTRSVKTLAYAEDTDGDGLRDDKEFAGISVYGVKTDPSDADTDDDGLPDGQEKYVREVAMTTRKTVGTNLWVDLATTVSGAIERVDVRYGLSSITVSNFFVELKKSTTYVTLRNRVGSGLYNYSSKDITTSFTHGGTATYSLHVTSSVSGGVLEEFALSFTLRTSPIKTDSDGDALNDSEETTYGVDAWITDPNRVDTDADAWSDSYEIQTKGTSPLAWDTDQDGVGDSSDLDPKRNLLVAVKVKKIHQAEAWCTPKLAGIVWVNGAYTWVTEHRMATEDWSWSTGCMSDRPNTAVFDLTYYADVPDGTSSVSVRAAAWGLPDGRWDDLIADATVGYTLQAGTWSYTIWNGNGASWMTFDVWTTALEKAKTLLVTDGNATVTASNGQVRLTGQDRYLVLTFDVTSSYAPFVVGVNTIVVPRSLFLESKLKKDFGSGSYWPLDGTDAKLYGEDLGKPDVSEGIAGVIAKALSGSNAKNVLDRIVRNTANVLTYSYVDITSYAVLVNLPADVVRILPWARVDSGPTGAPPEGFSDWFLNRLVEVGQLLYKGLVALATFLVDLGKAIVDWGMRALGTVSQAVGQAVQVVADVLDSFLDMVIDVARSILKGVVDTLLGPILDLLDSWAVSSALSVSNLAEAHERGEVRGEDTKFIQTLLDGLLPSLVFGLSIALVTSLIVVGFIMAATPVGAIVTILANLIKDIIRTAVKHWIVTTIILAAIMEWTLSNFTDAGQLPPLVVAGASVAWGAFMVWYGRQKGAPVLKDAFGLGLAILGTLIVFKVIPLTALKTRVLASLMGTSVSAWGLLLTLLGEDIAPGPLGFVDEVLAASTLGFDIAQTAIVVTDCVQGRGC